MPNMQLISISEQAQGSMSIGDRLVAVESDDTSRWPIERGC